MSKKYRTTQELANGFPDWSKIRQDDQSVGKGLLNVIGKDFDLLSTELYRGYSNIPLSTANVSEIDLIYRFSLPESFDFEVDNSKQLQPQPLSPTVSGRKDSTWYAVEEIKSGDIKDFWYNATPSRIVESGNYSGVTPEIGTWSSEDYTFSGFNQPFLPNNLYVDVSGSSLFAEANNSDGYLQAKVRITGKTWKETEEAEELEFIFSEKQRSIKVWKEISAIEAIDFPASGNIKIHSHGFNLDYYLDPFNRLSQYSHARDDYPTFWKIEESPWVSGLQLLNCETYAVTKALDILRNRTDKIPYREWELVDENNTTIEVVDIAPVPFSHRTWAVTTTGLYLYGLDWDTPDQKSLAGRTSSPLTQIVTQRDYVTREEEVEVELRFVRPIKTVLKHRLTIKYPDGNSFGVLADGTLVSTSSDYWIENIKESRLLRPATIFQFSDLGDHLLTLEVLYLGNITEIDKRIIRVASKTPIAQFDLFDIIGTTAQGVDIDHQHNLFVLDTNSGVHRLELHYDNMIIDFNSKELIFREPYDEIKVIK